MVKIGEFLGPRVHFLSKYGISPDDEVQRALKTLENRVVELASVLAYDLYRGVNYFKLTLDGLSEGKSIGEIVKMGVGETLVKWHIEVLKKERIIFVSAFSNDDGVRVTAIGDRRRFS